jgi:hypothetical protein
MAAKETPFKRGDVLIYTHPHAPVEGRGALAICTRCDSKDLVDVKWLLLTDYLTRDQNTADVTSRNWEVRSFEKVGHIDI